MLPEKERDFFFGFFYYLLEREGLGDIITYKEKNFSGKTKYIMGR